MSFVEIEHDTEKTFGVEISNISFEVDSDKEITAYCELINNKQKDDQIMLKYALYDLNGRVRGTQTFEYRKKKDIKIKPVKCFMDELKADKIGKIRLWIESW
jgi:hypothetical protein